MFGGEEGTGGSELAAGVGVGGEQPERRTRRSLAVDHQFGARAPSGGGCDVTRAGGQSQLEERDGMAAEVHLIDRRWKTRYGGFFG
jgi:hypothetical protein